MDECHEYDEVYVLVADEKRVSRNIRYQWFIDSLLNKNNPYDVEKPLHVIAQIPPENKGISTKTDVLFVFQRYRYVFMFDFSSSAFRINDLTYELIVNELMAAFKTFIKQMMKSYKCPGQFDQEYLFRPRVFCSVLGFLGEEKGHIVFEQDRLLTEDNYLEMIQNIENQLDMVFENYACNYNSDEGLVPMLRTGMIALQLLPSNCLAGIVVFTDGCTDVYGDLSYERTRDGGYGNSIAGEVAINDVLSQMRNQTISCSFVQVLENATQHSIGLVPNQNLLKFISSATSGLYVLFDTTALCNWPPNYWYVNRPDELTMNPIGRGLYCWSFQKGLNCSKYIPNTDSYWDVADMIRRWDQSECLTYPVESIQKKQLILFQKDFSKTRLNLDLCKIIECHLREGYMIKEIRIEDGRIHNVKLLIAWRPAVHIIFSAVYVDEHCTEVFISAEAPYEFLRCYANQKEDKKGHHNHELRYKCKICMFFINKGLKVIGNVDEKLEQLDTIKTNRVVTHIPEDYLKSDETKIALFRRQLPKPHNVIPYEIFNAEFIEYWKRIGDLAVETWQRWFHTHKFSIILTNQTEEIPSDLFLRNPNLGNQFPRINCDQAAEEINKRLKKWSTFPLEEGKAYIYIFERTKFCMIKLSKIGLFYLVRVAFLLGVGMDDRLKYFEDIKKHIFDHKSTKQSTPQIIRKPIERIMVRYKLYPNIMISPLNWSKLNPNLNQSSDQNTFNWQVLSYLHHRRVVWEIESNSIYSLNNLMMEIFRKRLSEGYQVLYSGIGGPITLIYELEFYSEKGRKSDCIDARDNMCVLQLVMFPPIPPNETIHCQKELSTYHLAMEIWIEPKMGKCRVGPDIMRDKDFMKITNDCFVRDHNLISMETTFNRLKEDCINKNNKGILFTEDTGLQSAHNTINGDVTEDKEEPDIKRVTSTTFANAFDDRMDRIIKVEKTFDLILLLKNCERTLYGFSLLQNPEKPDESNKGNDEIIEQLHASLRRANNLSFEPDKLLFDKDESITSFLCHQYCKKARVHCESESSTNDDDMYSSDEDNYTEYPHAEVRRQTPQPLPGPNWQMYIKYHDSSDEILVTFLPRRNRDALELEKELPEVFLDIMSTNERDLVLNDIYAEQRRKRNESICSSTKSNDTEHKIAHTHILPVFVCRISRAKLKSDLNATNLEPVLGFAAYDKRWEVQGIFDLLKRMDTVNPLLQQSHSQRKFRTESDRSKDSMNDSYIDDLYDRSFVRGIFCCLPQKIPVCPKDFQIALYLCIPVDRNIDITDAMLAWCDDWRHFYDEKNKKEESNKIATRNSSGGPYDEAYEQSTRTPDCIDMDLDHDFDMMQSPNITEMDPNDFRGIGEVKVLEISRKREPKTIEKELDTEFKIRRIISQSIQHYFHEFQNAEDEYATYFFRDPDNLHSEIGDIGQWSGSQWGGEGIPRVDESDESTDADSCIVEYYDNEICEFKEPQSIQYYIHDSGSISLSTEGRILDDVKNVTDEGKASIETQNSVSRDEDDDESLDVGIEIKTPLFLQMEMQIWATLANSAVIHGYSIPLKNNFITSIDKLIQEINSKRTEKVEKIILDKVFKVQLKFICWMVDDDSEQYTETESAAGSEYTMRSSQLPSDYQTAVDKTIQDVEMLIQDEVVAARRLQAVINSDILNFVTEHIRKNDVGRAKHNHHFDFDPSTSRSSVIPYLQCKFNYFPLRFVNYENNYDDAIKEFKSLLSMQNKFGVEDNGFSSPHKLFNHKDLKDDLRNYQFDIKNDDQYFYVILREIEDGTPRMEDFESDEAKNSYKTDDEPEDDPSTLKRRPAICHSDPSSSPMIGPFIDLTLDIEKTFKPIAEPANTIGSSTGSEPKVIEDCNDQEVADFMSIHDGSAVERRRPIPSSSSRVSIVSSTRSGLELRRDSNYKVYDDDVDAVKPDFWLILEISMVKIGDDFDYKDEYAHKHRFCQPPFVTSGTPRIYPVINIYHHRRTADEPMYQHVIGDPIQVIKRENDGEIDTNKLNENARKKNLTDADSEFILEIEDYIKNLVRHVNQAYLLRQLSIDRKCMLILMKQNYLSEESEEDQKFNNLQFGCFEFEAGEFEPQESHRGFGKDLVWSHQFKIHPRIARVDKANMNIQAITDLRNSRLVRQLRVMNRRNMYIYHNTYSDYASKCCYLTYSHSKDTYYCLINPEDDEKLSEMPISHYHYRVLSTDSEDSIPSYTTIRRPSMVAANQNEKMPTSITIKVFGIHPLEDKQRQQFFEHINVILHNATLTAIIESPRGGVQFALEDVLFIQPQDPEKKHPAPPNFGYFFELDDALLALLPNIMFRFNQLRTYDSDFLTDNQLRPVNDTKKDNKRDSVQIDEGHNDTQFLRYIPRNYEGEDEYESMYLSCSETMIMMASSAPHLQKKQKPSYKRNTFPQITAISFGLYRSNFALRPNFCKSKPRELSPREARVLLDNFCPSADSTDAAFEEKFNKWIDSTDKLFPEKPTIVFQLWMQCEGKPNVAAKFGPNSSLYKSLIGCFRCAIFQTLIEHTILLTSWAKDFERENKNVLLQSRGKGAEMVSPSRVNRTKKTSDARRKVNIADDTVSDSKKYEGDGGQYNKMYRAIVEATKKQDEDKVSSRSVRESIENRIAGALHPYYAIHFRQWIKLEAQKPYKSSSIHYEEYDYLPNWHAFWNSSWPKIRRTLESIWCDSTSECCPVFIGCGDEIFKPESYYGNVPISPCPGKYPEIAVLMRDAEDWRYTKSLMQTDNQAQPECKKFHKKLAQFGHEERNDGVKPQRRMACAMLLLEKSKEPDQKMKLVLYAFNIKEDIISKIQKAIKEAINVQLMRTQFMTSAMKLKLGLYHDLHQGLHQEYSEISTILKPKNKAMQRLSQPNKEKRQQFIPLDQVIRNVHDSNKSAQKQHFTFFHSSAELKKLVHCIGDTQSLDKIKLSDGQDYISAHAEQVRLLKATETARHDVYQKMSELLKDWEESFIRGKNAVNDPDNQLEDIKMLKRLSKMEYIISSRLHFHKVNKDINKPPLENGGIRFLKIEEFTKKTEFRRRTAVMWSKPSSEQIKKTRSAEGITERSRGRQQKPNYDDLQRQYLFNELNEHLASALGRTNEFTLRRVNLSTKDIESKPQSCYFQLCRKNTRAILIEVDCDLKNNLLHLIIYSFNLELFDFQMPNDAQNSKLKSKRLTNDIAISDEIGVIKENMEFHKFVATFHLKVVHKVFSEYFYSQCGSVQKKRLVELFETSFDYPNYFTLLRKSFDQKNFSKIAFDNDELIINYRHNTPAKEFFKYLVSDSTKTYDLNHEPGIKFVEFKTDMRTYILTQRRFDSADFEATCLIYQDETHNSITSNEQFELKLKYCVIVKGASDDINYKESIALVKRYINCPNEGLPKRFNDVGEKCYKGIVENRLDHLWKQQQYGNADLSDMLQLLFHADVCIIEISHEVDHRLMEFTKLQRQWFQKLGQYLIEESKAESCEKAKIQVKEFRDAENHNYHLAIFRCESDYSVLLVLTVGEGDGDETRLRALLKDMPRSVTWREVSTFKKYVKVKGHLRTEVENLIQSISLFLFKTMING